MSDHPTEAECLEILKYEMRKLGLIYLGSDPTGKTRDESMMLAAIAAMMRVTNGQ